MGKLLLLEDEVEIGSTLNMVLTKEGYQVTWAQDGEQAITAAKEDNFDLMVLDVMLKHGAVSNGMEVARRIQTFKDIPYVLLTSRSDSFDIMLALDMGAEDYITKPYDMTVLLARLRAIMRRLDHANKKENVLVCCDKIVLNLDCHTVRVEGKHVQLSNQLFQLLLYLVRNKDKVVSKEELYKNVWGYDHKDGYSTNTLEVNIKRLRKAIGQDYIRTIRGKGYIIGQ